MNRYLMAIYHYFRGYENFEIDAESKQDAIEKGREMVKKDFYYCNGGNYQLDNVICIKKLKPKNKRS